MAKYAASHRAENSANDSPLEGADTIVCRATLPDDGPTGGFFRDRKRIDW